jgi:hypothetical protein
MTDPDPTEEFLLKRETDREIWVKHRASGHVYEFQYLDGSKWASEFTIVPDLSSTVDADSLTTAARRAAREYLKRLQTERSARGSLEGAEVKVEAADFVQSPEPSPGNGAAAETSHQPPPRPPQQPPTGWMGTDDAANRIVQETEAARRRFVAATSSQVVDPIPPQAKTASQFALDASGRIDLVSDSPDLADSRQRDLYAEVRRTAIELSAAGHNQLGDLGGPANVFLEALPDNVEAASIVRVWSRGNTLRLRLSAHDAVDASAEPAEPARLTPLVAAKLSDVVQNFNAFINRDPSGRELDQLRIGPQERNEMLTAM